MVALQHCLLLAGLMGGRPGRGGGLVGGGGGGEELHTQGNYRVINNGWKNHRSHTELNPGYVIRVIKGNIHPGWIAYIFKFGLT